MKRLPLTVWLLAAVELAAAVALAAYLITGNPNMVTLCWVLLGTIAVTLAGEQAVIAWQKWRTS